MRGEGKLRAPSISSLQSFSQAGGVRPLRSRNGRISKGSFYFLSFYLHFISCIEIKRGSQLSRYEKKDNCDR